MRSPFNFGLQSEPPSHPELLDWLARELMRRNWSLKEMHKVILLSDTWQMSSEAVGPDEDRDPDNRFCGDRKDGNWRRNQFVTPSSLLAENLTSQHETLLRIKRQRGVQFTSRSIAAHFTKCFQHLLCRDRKSYRTENGDHGTSTRSLYHEQSTLE